MQCVNTVTNLNKTLMEQKFKLISYSHIKLGLAGHINLCIKPYLKMKSNHPFQLREDGPNNWSVYFYAENEFKKHPNLRVVKKRNYRLERLIK